MRAFFAAPLSDEARDEIAAYATQLRGAFRNQGRWRRQNPSPAKARERASSRGWVRPENYHVTLRFLGEIEEDRVAELSARLSQALSGCRAFRISTGKPFLMRSHRSRSVLALELSPAEPLVALAERIEACMREAGLPEESRSFRPHLTLARLRGVRGNPLGKDAPSSAVTSPNTNWPISEVVLYASHLEPGGARYAELASLPFQPDPAPPEDKQGDSYGSE